MLNEQFLGGRYMFKHMMASKMPVIGFLLVFSA